MARYLRRWRRTPRPDTSLEVPPEVRALPQYTVGRVLGETLGALGNLLMVALFGFGSFALWIALALDLGQDPVWKVLLVLLAALLTAALTVTGWVRLQTALSAGTPAWRAVARTRGWLYSGSRRGPTISGHIRGELTNPADERARIEIGCEYHTTESSRRLTRIVVWTACLPMPMSWLTSSGQLPEPVRCLDDPRWAGRTGVRPGSAPDEALAVAWVVGLANASVRQRLGALVGDMPAVLEIGAQSVVWATNRTFSWAGALTEVVDELIRLPRQFRERAANGLPACLLGVLVHEEGPLREQALGILRERFPGSSELARAEAFLRGDNEEMGRLAVVEPAAEGGLSLSGDES